jgi:RHS repeat-associated protein
MSSGNESIVTVRRCLGNWQCLLAVLLIAGAAGHANTASAQVVSCPSGFTPDTVCVAPTFTPWEYNGFDPTNGGSMEYSSLAAAVASVQQVEFADENVSLVNAGTCIGEPFTPSANGVDECVAINYDAFSLFNDYYVVSNVTGNTVNYTAVSQFRNPQCPDGYQLAGGDYTFTGTATPTPPFVTVCASSPAYFAMLPSPTQTGYCDASATNQGCAQTPEPIAPATGNESLAEPADYRSADGLFSLTRTYNSDDSNPGATGLAWRNNIFGRSVTAYGQTSVYGTQTVSPLYGDPATACVQGWLALAPYQPNSAGVTAAWTDGACVLSNGIVLAVYTNQLTQNYPLPIEVTVQRPSGATYLFSCTLQAGCQSSPNVALSLMVSANGFTVTAEDGSTESYNPSGTLQSITLLGGYTQTINSNNGQLTSVTDSFGRTLGFSFNALGQLQLVNTPDGPVQYGYDTTGRLTSVTYPDGAVRSYQYNNAQFTSALTGIIDEDGNTYASISYDGQGRALQSSFAGGVWASSINYATPQAPIVTDAFGVARTYQYTAFNGFSKLVSISGSSCNSCGAPAAISYDSSSGYYTSQTDWNGNITQYVYGTTGLLLTRIDAYGTPQQRLVNQSWDYNFRVPTEIDEPGRTTTFAYDGSGNVLSRTVTDLNTGATRTSSYGNYTGAGQPQTITGPRTDVSQVTQYSYYPIVAGDPRSGLLAQVTDALGHVTTFNNYNASSHPVQITDPNGLVTLMAYDARGRLISTQAGTELTQYTYDGVGQLTQTTLPNGSSLAYTYNAAHQLIGVQDHIGNRIVFAPDAMGNNTSEQIYNAAGALVQTHSRLYNSFNQLVEDIGAQNQVTAYQNDNNGNVLSITNPLGQQTSKAYDALNRLTTMVDANSGVTQYTYSALGQVVAVADPRTLVTTYVDDAFSDPLTVTSPDNGTIVKTFDAAGNVTSATDAKSQTTQLQYDALNRVIQITRADNSVVSFSYDLGTYGIGHLTGMTDPSGSTSWSYDQNGHVISKTSVVGSTTLTTAYSYDGNGRIVSMTLPSGKIVGYMWLNGQIVGLTLTAKKTTSPLVSNITYQPFGGPLNWTLGNGEAVGRVYDQDGRITADPIETVAYDAGSEVTSRTLGGASVFGDTQAFGYDSLQRVTSYSGMGGTIAFAYDPSGNRIRRVDNGTPTNYAIDPASNRILSQDHTALNAPNAAVAELIVVGIPSIAISVTPEAIEQSQSATLAWSVTDATSCTASGNWSGTEPMSGSQMVTPTSAGTYTYTLTCTGIGGSASSSAVLTVSPLPKGTTLYNYDGNGSLMSDGAFQYSYDVAGRLITAEKTPAGSTTPSVDSTYTYNGLSQRVQMNTLSGGTITLLYDESGHLLGNYTNGTIGTETVWLWGMPVAVVKPTATYFVHADYLNTPRQIDNASRQAVWTWEPVAFGANAPNTDPLNTGTAFDYKLRFPGQIADAEPGLRYNYYRDYDPSLGRYVQSDPMGLLAGVNTFAYVDENPVSEEDPLGLCAPACPNRFFGDSLAQAYLNTYGPNAWSEIRADRDSTQPVAVGTQSEAVRNAEHYLYSYTQVSNNSYNWGPMLGLTVGYNTLKFWANVGANYGLLNSPYTYSIPTSDELQAGLEGADDALFGRPASSDLCSF